MQSLPTPTTEASLLRPLWFKAHVRENVGPVSAHAGTCSTKIVHYCFTHFERRYPYLIPVSPAGEECLLVPFYVKGQMVGTIWGIMHSDLRRSVDGALETVRRTIRDADRASEVITRLRALFNRKETVTESVDSNEATREVIALSLSGLQRNPVVVPAELADDLPLVTGDRFQLQQVVLNLLRNGSDAMSTVDDRSRHLVIATDRDEGNRERLGVKDVGVGFEPRAVDRLFEGFDTTKNDGVGIGLSVSRSIIESHHGRLWAAKNDGPSSTFSFSIPCRREVGLSTNGTGPVTSMPSGRDAA